MRVAAIVVTYNRRELLSWCLQALEAQTYPLADIIVVNNASTDGTAEMLRTQFPKVLVLDMAENLGGSGGFAAGIEYAITKDYDWLWLMDDDVIPQPESLAQLVNAYNVVGKEYAPLGILHSLILNYTTAEPWGVFNLRKSFWGILVYGLAVNKHTDVLQEIDLASFNGCLLSVEAAKAVGVPDADLFVYVDDWDYSLRLRESGFRIIFVPQSKVFHRPTSPKPWKNFGELLFANRSPRQTYYAYRNAVAWAIRHKSVIGLSAAFAQLVHYTVRGIIVILVMWFGHPRSAYSLTKAVLLGLLHGFQVKLGRRM